MNSNSKNKIPLESKSDFFSNFSLEMAKKNYEKAKIREYEELKIKLKTTLEKCKDCIRERFAIGEGVGLYEFENLSKEDFREIVSSWLVENGMDLERVVIGTLFRDYFIAPRRGCVIM